MHIITASELIATGHSMGAEFDAVLESAAHPKKQATALGD